MEVPLPGLEHNSVTRRQLLKLGGSAGLLLTLGSPLLAACTGKSGTTPTASGSLTSSGASRSRANLAFWWWAEPDAPGADNWLTATAASYKAQTGVSVSRVTQATAGFVAAFSAAAKARKGPDLASQWAGANVLTQTLGGAIAPIQDLVPAAELSNWLNLWENEYDGKTWAASLYLVGSPLIYNKDLFTRAGLNPDQPPQTWDQFVSACEQLKAKKITPIVMGDKEGSAGLYFCANAAKQGLDSLAELSAAMMGQADVTSPKYADWLTKLEQIVQAGYFNPDVSSIGLDEGRSLFANGQGAITWGTDGSVASFQKSLGSASKVGVMKFPTFGSGALAQGHNATQSTSFFVTSWAANKAESADFLVYLHQPAQLASWYRATAVVPADARFDSSVISDPAMKLLAQYNSQGPQVWFNNFAPTQVIGNGYQVATSGLIAKRSTASQAAAAIGSAAKTWRTQNPQDATAYAKWVGGVKVQGVAGA